MLTEKHNFTQAPALKILCKFEKIRFNNLVNIHVLLIHIPIKQNTMRTNFLITYQLTISIILLFLLNLPLLSQEVQHQKKNLGSRMVEEYDVLKSNLDSKEGNYSLKIENFICQIGTYKENQRSGNWKVFYSKDELEFEFNYDTNDLTYLNKKFYIDKNDSTLIQPIFLGGKKYFNQSVKKNIDPQQMQWGDGSLIVSFVVDKNGSPHKFMLKSSSNYNHLDKLALAAIEKVATSDFKFIPAKKDNIPIDYVIDFSIEYIVRSAF